MFKDIVTTLEDSIANTLGFDENLMSIVNTSEPRKRNYGDNLESLVKSFRPAELPALISVCDSDITRGENATTAQDEYRIKCSVIGVIDGRTKEIAQGKAWEIIKNVEDILRKQVSGQLCFSGHGGMTIESPITQFDYAEHNNRFYYITTTEFTVYTVQEYTV